MFVFQKITLESKGRTMLVQSLGIFSEMIDDYLPPAEDIATMTMRERRYKTDMVEINTYHLFSLCSIFAEQ